MFDLEFEERTKPPGLYIHVPFCVSRCSYCAFTSSTHLEHRDLFIEALEREVALRARTWDGFDTLYLGGGTPSALGVERLVKLARMLGPLGLLPDASWTLEVNPDDCSRELLWGARVAGFSRLSIGAQSFDERALRFLGRRHSVDAIEQAVIWAREVGFQEVSLDLIYGLPAHSVSHWCGQLEAALRLEPDHLSCYELTLEPSTPLTVAVEQGKVELPDDEQGRALFLAGSEKLEQRGWVHYEVSSFARSSAHRSQHNLKYWTHTPYLGLGPGAHSYDGFYRWWNHGSIGRWARSLRHQEAPVESQETLDAEAMRLERLSLGFRQAGGVPVKDLRGPPVNLRAAIEDGLLVHQGDRVVPTRLGYLVADGLALRFA